MTVISRRSRKEARHDVSTCSVKMIFKSLSNMTFLNEILFFVLIHMYRGHGH